MSALYKKEVGHLKWLYIISQTYLTIMNGYGNIFCHHISHGEESRYFIDDEHELYINHEV